MAKLTRKYPISENEQALIDYFDTLEISSKINKIGGFVENEWPHVKFLVTFSKNSQKIELPYSLGLGYAIINENNISWLQKALFYKQPREYLTDSDEKILEYTKKSVKINKEYCMRQAHLVAMLTHTDNVISADVFANALRYFPETDFPEWCAEFDYNSDSIKAKSIYDKCLEHGYAAKKLVNHEQQEKLLALVQEI